jgi:uncharacterized protein (DUF952 family)
MQWVYKIISRKLWHEACAEGVFKGAAIDLQDGYIHLSGADQVETTARLHFKGQSDLLLVAFDAAGFGSALKWEASRGGTLFPHVYADIDPAVALWAKPLLNQGEDFQFPEGWR